MAIPLKYNLRSLLVRKVSTAMTAGGIALVVAVFVIVMAMVAGLATTISEAGSADNLVVLRKGATTETFSAMNLEQFEALRFLPEIRRDADGAPLISAEIPVQVLMDRVGGGRNNIVVRGVLPVALKVHDQVKIVQGRMFEPGVNEVIVGRGLIGRYQNCSVGSTLRFGRNQWKVVGVFNAGGSSFESEVWADVHNIQADTQRGSYFAAARIKTAPGSDVASLERRIADDPRINLSAITETEYYEEQSAVANQLRGLGMVVAVIMGIGAVFGAMNTMYAAVSSRTAEIGTLRALGFSPGAVLGSFLIESLILAVAAGVIGVMLTLPINGIETTFGNFMTFSTLAFDFRVTPLIMLEALIFAGAMGVLGGFFPARQAMKMSVVDSLRRA
ncbi:MAG: ABC transporter permease [Candidatus Binataceae bacterium]